MVNGFNAVANNISVILFPVILDLFLWLGPRLKVDALLAPIVEALPDIQSQIPADQARVFTQLVTDFQNGFNLFSSLRTFPLGVFSLMSTNIAASSPLGMRAAVDTPGLLTAFGAVLLLTFVGWMAGSLYFRAVSRVALNLQKEPGIFRVMLQAGLLSLVWMFFFTVANVPMLILLWLMSMLNAVLSSLLFIVLSVPIAWFLLGVYYSFYGIFSGSKNFFDSTRASLRMLRYGLPPLGWFTMLAILISQGMDMLWRVAPPGSWMMGIGILGHAFISTGLLAASFIYYRDINVWIETALQWINKKKKSSAQA